MTSNTHGDRLLWLWLALFAGLGVVAGGRWAIPVAAWLVGVFGVRFYRNYRRPIMGYLWVMAAMVAGGSVAWWGATFISNPAWEFAFMALMAPIAMLPFAVDRWVVRRFRRGGVAPFWTTLALPLASTAAALLLVGKSPAGTFGAEAYSQFGWEPVMQLASVTGIWGFTFLIAWFASVVNFAWEAGFAWRRIARGVVTYATVLALVVGFGVSRLWLAPEADESVRVVGLVSETPLADLGEIIDEPSFAAESAAFRQGYLDRTVAAAQRGADIVVWPEGAGLGDESAVAALLAAGSELAAEHGIHLVMPTVVVPADGEGIGANEVRIIRPDGTVGLTHEKYGGNVERLFGERGAAELASVETRHGTLSAIICWDADYPDTVTQAGRMDVDLLFVVSNDWLEVRDIHAEMAVFRAVENGTTVFRAGGSGVSLVADPYGRVLEWADTFDGEYELDALVPLNRTSTLYPHLRDAFGWAAVAGFIVLLAAAWYFGRTHPEPAEPEPSPEPLATVGA